MLLNRNVLNRIFLVVCISLSVSTFSEAGICDSIGVERKDGKLFILHRITAGETLYSISKKYNVSVDELKKTNPEAAQGLKLGQILKVPAPLPASPAAATASAADGKTHTVAAGETLYSIATKYGISVDALKKANPGLSSSISVGQQLNLPGKAGSQTAAPATKPATTTTPAAGTEIIEHKVASGETLYSIAKKYNVSVEDIKKANPGIGSLKVGQVVKVAGVAVAVPATTTTTTTTKPTTPATTPTTATTTKPVATTTNPEADTVQLQQDKVRLETMTQTPPTKSVPASDFKKITESGYADVMLDNQDTPKYLAYHKTAPVGTIIQLLNESNGVKIYVRVVGKLVDTGIDGKTIIRVSKKAYDRLGGTGTRFSATLMYIP
ncbi:LysM peptidoglycan-binding domain-containing protein [Cytophaga aurantiaca]|uniref:LysM peptidoglycan-binding domain-containing protein n=1 Tax=Cytophaga aurantiaca TaxID=29530 RepID=UPI0003761799|nr:LysM peptidoglycan-binding domain-containing protein [Cytophaga aurantiaca]